MTIQLLNKDAIQAVLRELGMTQKDLAEQIGVSPQSVTNWLKGQDFPRPAKLLKLATILKLNFEQLVNSPDKMEPIVAFRKKGNSKTTYEHISKAKTIGNYLIPIVEFLPEQVVLRTLITSPTCDYDRLQKAVIQTKNRLGLGEQAVLEYEHLITEFKDCGAILVPVMWGEKKVHENAIHIRLPKDDLTFIFLNLDTKIEDFKFWMAHELAHVLTPEHAGSEFGEDYADAFAGALLFPKQCVERAYAEAIKQNSEPEIIKVLYKHSDHYGISINTVYQQTKAFIAAEDLPELEISERNLHKFRNHNSGELVSSLLFNPTPPSAETYIQVTEKLFQSDFFHALKAMIINRNPGWQYIKQILDVSIYDARGIYEALTH